MPTGEARVVHTTKQINNNKKKNYTVSEAHYMLLVYTDFRIMGECKAHYISVSLFVGSHITQ